MVAAADGLAREPGRTRRGSRSLPLLRKLGGVCATADWKVTAILETDTWQQPTAPPVSLDILPGDCRARLLGAALDIGTTSSVVYLVNLVSGEVVARAVDYNGQIARGEDVISRIIYAGKNGGLAELQELVLQTFNRLLAQAAQRAHVQPGEIYKATVAGNSTMIHLFLGLPPQSIRLSPFVTTVNQPPPRAGGRTGPEHPSRRPPWTACQASPATSAPTSAPASSALGCSRQTR